MLYRYLRDEMVIRMRVMGISWATINKVLDSFVQNVVTHIEKEGDKIIIGFNKKGTKVRKALPGEIVK